MPLGAPGDLQFLAPNRGLLAVEGNATVPRGPVRLRRRSAGTSSRPSAAARAPRRAIASPGPREFWTVTEPSQPRAGTGTALCHFKDGEVVGSYSTPLSRPTPTGR